MSKEDAVAKSHKYDYTRITLSFRNDIDNQKVASDYLSAVSTHNRIDFITALILHYVESQGITNPSELPKIVKSGNLFDQNSNFSDAQKREIKALIAEVLGDWNFINPLLSSNQVTDDEEPPKKKTSGSSKAKKQEKEKEESSEALSTEEANVLSSMMGAFS